MEDKYLRRINFSNKAKRVPICFCIDTSDSMGVIVDGFENVRSTGEKVFTDQREYEIVEGGISLMDKIHEGLKNFYDAILDDDMACDSCESAIVTFNDRAKLYEGFSSVEEKSVPNFSSLIGGNTNVSPAIRMALDLLAKQKEFYKNNKISYFQPWLVLFTDGLPTDDVSAIKRELMQMQDDDKLSVYTMALSDDPDLLNALRGFSKKQPIRCADPKEIQRFFDFLAKSVSVVAAGGIPKDFF
jgi:uncharacterized protein YegL